MSGVAPSKSARSRRLSLPNAEHSAAPVSWRTRAYRPTRNSRLGQIESTAYTGMRRSARRPVTTSPALASLLSGRLVDVRHERCWAASACAGNEADVLRQATVKLSATRSAANGSVRKHEPTY
jgi:hypothetical protein